MSCFPCFKSKEPAENDKGPAVPVAQAREPVQPSSTSQARPQSQASPKPNSPPDANNGNSSAKTFTFRELATACKNFRQECLIGEGAFGKLFKGTLQPNAQVVMVKNLDKNSMHGNKEFTVEVMMLTLLQHPNLLKLIGYCADGDQRLLVYEYMPKGTVEDHLLDPTHQKKPLDWTTRMKIAAGAAEGLEYLHEKANPPIIYRDLKSSSILLDEEFNPKLSDYGLAKLTSGGNSNHLPPRVMGNYGYCAPEYERQGELTVKSDVYSFGVILLELISGRRALDTSRPADEQNLVAWAQPIFRDPKRFPDLADPLLKDKYPVRSLNQAVGVAAMCLQDEPEVRPLIEDIVAALSFLAVAAPDEPVPKSILQSSVSLANLNRENSCYKELHQESHNNHQGNVADDQHNGNESDNKDQEQEDNESEVSSESSDDEDEDQVANVKSDNTDDRNGGYDYDSDEISMTSDDTDYEDEEENEQAKSKSVKKGSSSRKNPGEVDFEIGSMSSDSRNSSLDKSENGSIKENSLSVKSTKKAKKSYANTGRAISERRGKKESGNGGPGLSSVHSYHPGSSGLGS